LTLKMYSLRILKTFKRTGVRCQGSAATARPGVDPGTYCRDLVRKRDYEHYLTTLLLPESIRSLAMVLRAFNVEVASVRDSVSDANTGMIRLQFWKDAVEAVYSSSQHQQAEIQAKTRKVIVPNHPVVNQLVRLQRLGQLGSSQQGDKDVLLQLVESKHVFFNKQPFKTFEEVDTYSKESFSNVNFLLLRALAASKGQTGEVSGHARHCTHQLGLAEGLCTLLRGIPYNASKRRVNIPSDLLLAHKIPSESIVRGSSGDDVRHVVEAIAARADEHLQNCRFRAKFLSKDEKLLLLPAVAVDAYLSKLHTAKCNVFDPSIQKTDSLLPVRMYIKKFKRSF